LYVDRPASVVPSKAGSAEALIETAAKAMYTTKNDGRNRVVVAPQEKP
jgi:PleD family two-component response regulator